MTALERALVGRPHSSATREGERFAALSGTRVVVAISNGVLRQGMRTLLLELPLWSVRGCRTLQEAGLDPADPTPSVLVLADSEPALIPWVAVPPAVKVLVLLAEPSGIDAPATFSRADGFLLQGELNVHTLGDALSQVLSGQFPLPPAVARRLVVQGPLLRRSSRAAQLTKRQHETLRLLSEGLSNRQIGRRLRISENGAKRLVAGVLTKLDAPNRARAVAVGLREGLLT